MPLTKAQKIEVVKDLHDKLSRKKVAVFVSFSGVDVKTASDFRSSVRQVNGDYKVAKKTLLKRALDELKISVPQELLTGQVGIALDYYSQTSVAKTLHDFTKKSKFSILGGLMGDEFLDASRVKELALLPGLDVMRARVIGTIQSPISGLVRTLHAIPLQLINVLNAIAAKKS